MLFLRGRSDKFRIAIRADMIGYARHKAGRLAAPCFVRNEIVTHGGQRRRIAVIAMLARARYASRPRTGSGNGRLVVLVTRSFDYIGLFHASATAASI